MTVEQREALAHQRHAGIAHALERFLVLGSGIALGHEQGEECRMDVAGEESRPAFEQGLPQRRAVAGELGVGVGAREIAKDGGALGQDLAAFNLERRHLRGGIDLLVFLVARIDADGTIFLAKPFEDDVDRERAGTGGVV